MVALVRSVDDRGDGEVVGPGADRSPCPAAPSLCEPIQDRHSHHARKERGQDHSCPSDHAVDEAWRPFDVAGPEWSGGRRAERSHG